jgi:putative tryptophan/tyrosine transport system substrate-binding protein
MGRLEQRLLSPAGYTSAVLAGQPRQVHLRNRPPRPSTLASESAVPVVGFLHPNPADYPTKYTVAFLQGLKEIGYVVGQNVAVEYRYADNKFDRLRALAADLVRRRLAVIVVEGNDAALAAKGATATIPIVFFIGMDPVALGLVASLNRPGANVTGIVNLSVELAPKQLRLLRELAPNAALFGVVVDPAIPVPMRPRPR